MPAPLLVDMKTSEHLAGHKLSVATREGRLAEGQKLETPLLLFVLQNLVVHPPDPVVGVVHIEAQLIPLLCLYRGIAVVLRRVPLASQRCQLAVVEMLPFLVQVLMLLLGFSPAEVVGVGLGEGPACGWL